MFVVGLDLVGMLNRHLLLWISFVWRFNGFNCRYYLSVFVFNDKFNLSFAMRFARFGVGGFKGCFDVGIVVGGEVYVSICGG
ncbi:hypothetical protein BSPWISOXPB_7386 [uncultured Gammaproteobacteria bacterium]|nr:hypothetical protein BSPWISOXPB_7386 [uncultured Gammaproteobacteria bacterium]